MIELSLHQRQPTTRLWTGLAGFASTALFLVPASPPLPLSDATQAPVVRQHLEPRIVVAEASASDQVRLLRSTAAEVKDLHARSGLTWDQLGRAFGVSRRAVHLWAAGGRMNAHHSELLAELTGIIDQLPASDPATRRMLIFEPRRGMGSIFDEFLRRQVQEDSVVPDAPPPLAQLFGVRYEDT